MRQQSCIGHMVAVRLINRPAGLALHHRLSPPGHDAPRKYLHSSAERQRALADEVGKAGHCGAGQVAQTIWHVSGTSPPYGANTAPAGL